MAALATQAIAQPVTKVDADLSAEIDRNGTPDTQNVTHNNGDSFPTTAERLLDIDSQEADLVAMSRSRLNSNTSFSLKSLGYIDAGLGERLEVTSSIHLVREFTLSQGGVNVQRTLTFFGDIAFLNNESFGNFDGMVADLSVEITSNTAGPGNPLVQGSLGLEGSGGTFSITGNFTTNDPGTINPIEAIDLASALPDPVDEQFKAILFNGGQIVYEVPGIFFPGSTFLLTIDMTSRIVVDRPLHGAEVVFGLTDEPMLEGKRQPLAAIPEPATAVLLLVGLARATRRRAVSTV